MTNYLSFKSIWPWFSKSTVIFITSSLTLPPLLTPPILYVESSNKLWKYLCNFSCRALKNIQTATKRDLDFV